MKIILYILVVLGISGLYSHCALAFQSNNLNPGNIRDMEPEITLLRKQLGNLNELHGEIIVVDEGRILLIEKGSANEVVLDENTKVYVNGRLGQLKGLRPICNGCNFLARVWVNDDKKAVLIDGYYWGADVVVENAVALTDGRYCLVIRDAVDEETPCWIFETTTDCYGLEKLSSQSLLGACYVLFDLEGKIRGLFQ